MKVPWLTAPSIPSGSTTLFFRDSLNLRIFCLFRQREYSVTLDSEDPKVYQSVTRSEDCLDGTNYTLKVPVTSVKVRSVTLSSSSLVGPGPWQRIRYLNMSNKDEFKMTTLESGYQCNNWISLFEFVLIMFISQINPVPTPDAGSFVTLHETKLKQCSS